MKLFAAVVIGVAIGTGIAILVAAREQERAVADVIAQGSGVPGSGSQTSGPREA